jgi:predicted secreted protein
MHKRGQRFGGGAAFDRWVLEGARERRSERGRKQQGTTMSLTFGLALYFIIWWTVLFAVLPFGVRTQGEAGEVVPGTPASAPVAPRLLRTFAITTVVAGGVFALVYAVLAGGIVDIGAYFPNPMPPGAR